ncbi:MAG: TPM domain-containing protein [Oceanihabitans sp.]
MQYLVGFKSLFYSISRKFHFLTIAFIFFSFQQVSAQFTIPEIPEFQTSVYDYINLLTANEKKNLENKLVKYSDTTSTQIVIAIIPSTKGENIMQLGTEWAHKWGVGQEKEDNGIFILLAKDDRKIAIATGYGVEHLLTDAISRRIIQRDIIPFFKQNNYYGGLNRGTDAVFEVMTGEYKGTRKNNSNDFPVGLLFFLIIIFLIILIAISKNRRNGNGTDNFGGGSNTTRDILEAIILSNSGRGGYRRSTGGFGGGGWSGGSSGGGFGGGFGGGGFGGGGASGGW